MYRQTDRQTDICTDRQTYIQTIMEQIQMNVYHNICYYPVAASWTSLIATTVKMTKMCNKNGRPSFVVMVTTWLLHYIVQAQ